MHGIDASKAMVAKLRAKPGGDAIPVTIGDFADVAVAGRYPLIYVAFNTFFALLTQDDQVRCFANVANRLTETGVFVLEVFVPDLSRFDRGQRVRVDAVEVDEVKLGVERHDAVNQISNSMYVFVREGGIRLYPVKIRYAWPAELDLMARLAGLRLRERWGNWTRVQFTDTSGQHVSVYERA